MRKSGMLMPVSALPGAYGIGCFSKEAYDFVDQLEKAGQQYWQILPLGPTGYGDSPYQSFSSYAGNPYMIDFDDLKEEGLLQEEEYASLSWGDQPTTVDYGLLYGHKFTVLKTACSRISGALSEQFQKLWNVTHDAIIDVWDNPLRCNMLITDTLELIEPDVHKIIRH